MKQYGKQTEIKPELKYNNYKIEECGICKGIGSINGINCDFCHKCNYTGNLDHKGKIKFKRMQFLENRYLIDWNLCRIHNLSADQISKSTNPAYKNFDPEDRINVGHYNKIQAIRNDFRKQSDDLIDRVTNGKWLDNIPSHMFDDTKSQCQQIYTEFQFAIFGKYIAKPERELIPKGYGILPFQVADLWDYRAGHFNAKIMLTTFLEYQKLQKQFKKVSYRETKWLTNQNRGYMASVKMSRYDNLEGVKIASYTK